MLTQVSLVPMADSPTPSMSPLAETVSMGTRFVIVTVMPAVSARVDIEKAKINAIALKRRYVLCRHALLDGEEVGIS